MRYGRKTCRECNVAHLVAVVLTPWSNLRFTPQTKRSRRVHEASRSLSGSTRFLDPDGYPAITPPWGTLTAIDLNKGTFAWQKPFGEYPELAAKGMTNTGSENYGGGAVTAGGLFFIAATNFDKKFRAFDKLSGELLWEKTLPFAGNATPAVYEVDDTEYVVIASGGGKSVRDKTGGQFIAFALR